MNNNIPRHWRLKNERYRLVGSLCPRCQQPHFPPRPTCSYEEESLIALLFEQPVENRLSLPLPASR
jgi:uncharacterized OB-fold protein